MCRHPSQSNPVAIGQEAIPQRVSKGYNDLILAHVPDLDHEIQCLHFTASVSTIAEPILSLGGN